MFGRLLPAINLWALALSPSSILKRAAVTMM